MEFAVIHGIERGVCKWSVAFGEPQIIKPGQTQTKLDAIAQAEKTIDRAVASKREKIPADRGELDQPRQHGGFNVSIGPLIAIWCQGTFFLSLGTAVALAPLQLVGVAETGRARLTYDW